MFLIRRRSAMKMRDGRVQRKNRTDLTPNYFRCEMPSLVIDRQRPGHEYRHVVQKDDVRRFIALLPNWSQLAIGLNAIVLGCGDESCFGWHRRGVVVICAWDRELVWNDCCPEFFENHRQIFEKLDIPVEQSEDSTRVNFTESTARAFLLVHVLVHELGHHHDRMTTRSKRFASRGEAYAEEYARQYEDQILARYWKTFRYA